jgi:hypothetical protein
MRIKIPANIALTPARLIKRCGYAEIRNRAGKVSYVHRLGGYRYPRFHVYVDDNWFNLHLDQKAPIYQGVPAHSGEYESEVVKKEAERIKQYIEKIKKSNNY